MRHWRLIIIFPLLLLFVPVQAQNPQPGAVGIGDPLAPTLGNGGYDAQHYTLDLDVDLEDHFLGGTVTIDALATQDLSAFNLDFIGFDIESITVNDQTAQFERDERELHVTPHQPLIEGEAFRVAVTYFGMPGDTFDESRTFSRGWNWYDRGVFVASEPTGAAAWYPVNDHPLDKATYTFRITVPDPYVVAANGLLVETVDEGGYTTYVWENNHLTASYLVTVNIAGFTEVTEEGPDGLLIRNYFPTDLADDAVTVFERTADMMAFYNEIFGPYPFDAYGVVVADTTLFFALETQTISLFGSQIVPQAANEGGSQVSRAEITVAHELAHQWFGNSVSLENWGDIWLNEGFATYASALWVEHDRGKAQFEGMMQFFYDNIVDRNFTPGSPDPDELFGLGVYQQGAWALHALRLEVGDEAFFKIMRTYADRFKYGNASTADFIAVAEEISSQDLEALFDAWLFDGGVPETGQ